MEVRKSILSIFWVFLPNKIAQFLYRIGRNKHTAGKYFPKNIKRTVPNKHVQGGNFPKNK